MKPQVTLALSVFAICAVVSAVGGYLLFFSLGQTEKVVGCFLLIIFGLAAMALPRVILELRGRGRGDES